MAVYNDATSRGYSQDGWTAQGYSQTQAPRAVPYADPQDDEPSRMAQVGATASTLANVSGALVSLALIAGLGVWGYKLMVRDVSGIPVVQALDTPMRIAPDDPGGTIADHQGLSVNEIAVVGASEDLPETITLAPGPMALAEEDQPQATLQPETVAAIDPVEPAAPQSTAEAGEVQPAPVETDPVQAALDVSAQITASLAQDDAGAPAISSAIPKPRPAGLRAAKPAAAPAPAAAPTDLNPKDIAPGTRLVQFGAYDTPEIARVEWDKLAARFDGLMEGKSRVIQEASAGGKTFYRLRAMGFDDLADARQFCAAMVNENAACIPTQAR